MSRSRLVTSIAAAALGISLFGACSAESLTERAVGFGLEQAIEGDQDIDLDFSDEGGGFSIKTDEGDFAINFDDDSGGIVYNTDEGEGVISFDEDGIVYNTDEGDGTISFDEDNGSINFEGDGGEGSIDFGNDDGSISFTNDDGLTTTIGLAEAPPTWPAEIPFPATSIPNTQGFSVVDLGAEGVQTTGSFQHADNDPYASNLVAGLQAAGWTPQSVSDANGSVFAVLEQGGALIQVIGDVGYSTVSIQAPAAS